MVTPEFTSAKVGTRDLREGIASALSVEIALYAALFLFAFFIRLFVLDLSPLNSDEARQALGALKFARGDSSLFTGSPLLFTLNFLFFTLFGASDFAARLAPVFFGTALVLLPAFFSRDLGRVGSLIASALLAFSPSLVFFSRSVDGIVPATTCALAAIFFGKRYLASRVARDLYFAAAFAALTLLSAADAWTIVLSLAFYIVVSRFRRLSRFDNQGSKNGNLIEARAKNHENKALLFFFFVFVGTATTLFLHREGIGAAFDLLGAWTDSLRVGGSLLDVLRLLLVYEPLILFFGLAEFLDLLFSPRQGRSNFYDILGFLVATAFFLLSFSANNDPSRIVILVVPLALLAGANIGGWVERTGNSMRSVSTRDLLTHETPILAVAVGLTSFLAILISELAQRGNILSADTLIRIVGSTQDYPNLSGMLVAALFLFAAAATSILAITTLGSMRAKTAGILFILGVLFLWTVRQMTMLNFPAGGALNPQEWMVTSAAAPNVRDLVNDLKDASRWRANDTHTIAVAVDSSLGPLLEWNLRDLTNTRFVQRPTASLDVQALVLPGNASAPAEGWIAQRYQIEFTRGASGSALRALIFRDSGSIEALDAMLWIPKPQ